MRWTGPAIAALLGLVALVSVTLVAAYAPVLLGYESLIVTGGSMGSAVPAGAVAHTRLVDPEEIDVGDVVSYRTVGSRTTTHRVVAIERIGRRIALRTKGDANATADSELFIIERSIHRVEWVVPYAGTLIRFGRTQSGRLLLFALPIAGLSLDRPRRRAPDRAAAAG